ncbi:MAG: pyruvate:ferredoxin (flavodoxin) oxidoreductase [Acidobacteriota bacterium]
MERKKVTIDGNEATAYTAYHCNEVCAIYPITPSSNMGEWADEWASQGKKNIWGTVPSVIEMQSEGGASGAVHGSLQTGALTTTFTASQGLLLMIPNMFKIAGELTSTVFHVSARTVATHALSIFGDHSDVMATRQTGWGLLSSASVQEAMDFALIAQAATLKGRVPVVHFFDGFRTSHEVQKIEQLLIEDMKAMIDDDLVREHRQRALNPEKPILRGTAQNPDVFFQARETNNPYYEKFPQIMLEAMEKFEKIVGRKYRPFEYYGDKDAERIIILMGSGCETASETVDYLNEKGAKVGIVKVRLYRPFSVKFFIESLPKSVKAIAVLDRTKEPGAAGEPLYKDVVSALSETMVEGKLPFAFPKIIGGRYGLSSKEFTPAMVKAVFDELEKKEPKNHFTVGINDDVSKSSLNYDPSFVIEKDDVVRCVFYGLGSDGTVGANKNSIKIIGEETNNYAQGYFVYDSKKAGAVTISHLRFGPRPIKSIYLIDSANFVACHQFVFLEKYDMLKYAKENAVFLLNSPYSKDEIWDKLPRKVQQQIIDKKLQFYVIDGYKVAKEAGMGSRVNTIMQTCFFAISGVLPKDEAIKAIKKSIEKTYGRKGEDVVKKNFEAVDKTLANLYKVDYPNEATSTIEIPPPVSPEAPDYVKNVLAKIIAGEGDYLPVSAFSPDGTFPTDTAKWEKRNIALEIPVWEPALCIQCGKCAIVCPHAAIRIKAYDGSLLAKAPATFKSTDYKGVEFKGMKYTIQIAPEDCTGCGACVFVCPSKDKTDPSKKALNMADQIPLRIPERENYNFFLELPEVDVSKIKVDTVKGSQFLMPLFEYSGACAGCGETPYLKLMSQLFGDRAIVANATGCSSIYGGNLPTTPWAKNKEGKGPAWSNSLFEDNAEFGLGFRLAIDKQREFAVELMKKMSSQIGEKLVDELIANPQKSDPEIALQRKLVGELKNKLKGINSDEAKMLSSLADSLIRKSVWIVGGDGWAYDIGYGGLDHVLASMRNVNLLVLDTGVYSNTGGQCSKATPLGGVAKFAMSGKPTPRKDIGLMAIAYGSVYVAQVALGANDNQTVKAFVEAENYDGPSIIIAYSHCIAHGIDMMKGMEHQKLAVECGLWPLYRYNPDLIKEGKNPLKLDSKPPKISYKDFAMKETRFRMLEKTKPELVEKYMQMGDQYIQRAWQVYNQLAAVSGSEPAKE